MKHNPKITMIILAMFLLAQFIGLFVINAYLPQKIVNGVAVNQTSKTTPYGMGFQNNNQVPDFPSLLISFLFSLIIAITIILFLVKVKAKFAMKAWFFAVSILAIGISFTAILPSIKYASLIALALAIPLAIFKTYKRNLIVHNITEILIYPGIAAIFVPILGIWGIIGLLIVISIYDMWAVWKSKLMLKMANYQMKELHVFGGVYIPYASKKVKEKIKLMKQKFKTKEKLEKAFKKSKLKVNAAILGGGDIAYSIISAGVVLKVWGFVPSLITIAGSLTALTLLLIFSKKKPYPAMPFLTAGIFLSLIINYLFII